MSHQRSPSSEDKPGDLVGLYLLTAYSPRDTTKVFILFYIYSYGCAGGVWSGGGASKCAWKLGSNFPVFYHVRSRG